MDEEIQAYEEYLLSFGSVNKPTMPKFYEAAYTDNEYLSAFFESYFAFENIDDEYLSILHLKGD